jgi:hypothetical protein
MDLEDIIPDLYGPGEVQTVVRDRDEDREQARKEIIDQPDKERPPWLPSSDETPPKTESKPKGGKRQRYRRTKKSKTKRRSKRRTKRSKTKKRRKRRKQRN